MATFNRTMQPEAAGRRRPSNLALVGLLGVVCVVAAFVVLSKSGTFSTGSSPGSPGVSITMPTVPPGNAQVPRVNVTGRAPADAAASGAAAAVAAAGPASAGVGQVLITWFLVADVVLALVALFGLLFGGAMHLLHWPRAFGWLVLRSIGIAEAIFVTAPIALVLLLRLLSWGGGLLLASTSSLGR